MNLYYDKEKKLIFHLTSTAINSNEIMPILITYDINGNFVSLKTPLD